MAYQCSAVGVVLHSTSIRYFAVIMHTSAQCVVWTLLGPGRCRGRTPEHICVCLWLKPLSVPFSRVPETATLATWIWSRIKDNVCHSSLSCIMEAEDGLVNAQQQSVDVPLVGVQQSSLIDASHVTADFAEHVPM